MVTPWQRTDSILKVDESDHGLVSISLCQARFDWGVHIILSLIDDHLFGCYLDKIIGRGESTISLLDKSAKHEGRIVIDLVALSKLFRFRFESTDCVVTPSWQLALGLLLRCKRYFG